MDDRNVLLVEDNPDDVKLALIAFQEIKFPHKIVVARDGADALDYLFRRGAHAKRDPGAPMLVILDLKLPRVSGLEVLAALRKDALLRHVLVAVLTSSNEERDQVEATRRGANLYFRKPTDFPEFLEIAEQIKHLVSGSAPRK